MADQDELDDDAMVAALERELEGVEMDEEEEANEEVLRLTLSDSSLSHRYHL